MKTLPAQLGKIMAITAIVVVALALFMVATQVSPASASPIAQATAVPTKAAAPVTPTTGATAGSVTATVAAAVQQPEVPFVKQWQGSGHADFNAMAFRDWDEAKPPEVPATCAKCHSSGGFQDFLGADGSAAGKVDKPASTNTVISCTTCHNSGTANHTSVTFPSGATVEGLGPESRCMECHQGRESKISVDKQITDTFKLDPVKDLDTVVKPLVSNGVTTTFGFRNIHYFAAAATQFGTLVKGGYEYDGQAYDGKFQHPAPFDTCNGCHNPHSLELNVEQCATCHQGVKTVEDVKKIRMMGSLMDYDGDGDAKEGVQSEWAGLQEKLLTAIQSYAKDVAKAPITYDVNAYPYWYADANSNGKHDDSEKNFASWTPRLLKAAYNYQVSGKDPGAFAHNAKYVIQLLHDSINDLNEKLTTKVDISKAARNDAGHFDGTSMAFRDWDAEGEVPAGCAKCHSATGLPEFIKNGGGVAVATNGSIVISGVGAQPLSNGLACSTCHDDLGKYTLRAVTTVPFPSGKSVTFSTEKDDKGNLKPVNANLCLECHQGRQSTLAVNTRIGKAEDDKVPDRPLSFLNVHYFAAGASLFGTEAQVGYEYAGKEYSGRFMHAPGFQTCTDCHNTHQLGLNFDKCTTCHSGVKTPQDIRFSPADFDGDKDVKEGRAQEFVALEEKLLAALQDYAKTVAGKALAYDPNTYPYFFEDANGNGKGDQGEKAYASWTPRLLRAAYNYQYVQKDPGIFAHNATYGDQLVYDALEDLGKGGVKVDLTGLTRADVKKAQ